MRLCAGKKETEKQLKGICVLHVAMSHGPVTTATTAYFIFVYHCGHYEKYLNKRQYL